MQSSGPPVKRNAAPRIADWLFSVTTACISRFTTARDRALGKIHFGAESEHGGSWIERVSIAGGADVLDAVLVAPASLPPRAAVLICHGIGEIVEHWIPAQRLLAASGIVSLVFDYSGYGRSRGWANPDQCERDAASAFAYLQERLPSTPISILGFSMGSGIAAAVLRRLPVHRLVLCAAFTSFKAVAVRVWPSWGLVPDIWHTQEALRACSVPVLLVHGSRDQLIPLQMALDLQASCASPVQLAVLPDVGHNDPFYHPRSSYWGLVADFLLAGRNSKPSPAGDAGS